MVVLRQVQVRHRPPYTPVVGSYFDPVAGQWFRVNGDINSARLPAYQRLDVFEMGRVAANVAAWMVSTIPAYLLSRYWVWQQRGSNSVRSELAPFWILALVGLVFSTLCVWLAGFFTESTLALIAVNFCAYGVVWVAKYVVLERMMWGDHAPRNVEVEVV